MAKKKQIYGQFITFCYWIILIITSNASAEDLKPLSCFSTVYPPFVIQNKINDEITGIDVDLIREVGRRIKQKINIELDAWKRLEHDLKSGSGVHCVFSYLQTPERLNYMNFTSVPLHTTRYTFFIRQDNDLKNFQSLNDLKGWRIAVHKGFKTTPEFEIAVKNGVFKIDAAKDDEQSFKMLSVKRIDAVLSNQDVGAYTIQKLQLIDITTMNPPLSVSPAFLVFSKEKQFLSLVTQFNTELEAMVKDGTYQKIYERYTKL